MSHQSVPKLWIFVFLFVGAVIIAIIATGPQPPASTVEEAPEPDPTRYATFEQMLEKGDNAIYVENQASDSPVVQVGFVVLSTPGYVVIFDDDSGVPGSIVGESDLLESGGEHLVVPVDEPLVDDAVYYAVLYHDNGDERFRSFEDVQVLDDEQSVVLMTFLASTDAHPETAPVNP